jgi:hydrogenase maturation protease
MNGTRISDGEEPMSDQKTLLIGVGNAFRGDDAVGIYVAQQLASRDLPEVVVEVQSGEGAALIECWRAHRRVFLIDAAAPGGSPGQILRFEAHKDSITTGFFQTSSHAFGVLDAIELSRALDTLPEELIVYGIEGVCFDEGAGLSEEIEAAADLVVEQILNEIGNFNEIGGSPKPPWTTRWETLSRIRNSTRVTPNHDKLSLSGSLQSLTKTVRRVRKSEAAR